MNPPKNLHRLLAVLTVAVSIAISILTPATGIYAHWHWAPVVLGLLTNIKALLPAPPIAGIAPALLVAASLMLGSCASVPKPAPDCKAAALALLGELGSALIQENWENAVDALLTDPHGGLCAVEEGLTIISKQSADNAASSGDKLEILKAQRSKAWLAGHAQ